MKLKVGFLFLYTVLAGLSANAQLGKGTSNIQLGGGYTSTGISTTFEEAKGYLINASYEHWFASQVGVGGSGYYLHGSLEEDDGGKGTFSSLPLCFTGKYYIGKSKLKGFAMVSLGAQFSWRNLEDNSGNSGSDHDWGLATGCGLGLVYAITPKVLVNLNYSLLFLKNAYYSDGVVNAFAINLGYILGNK